ncbi:hypothetical protein D3C86_1645080 [compost metagenome]
MFLFFTRTRMIGSWSPPVFSRQSSTIISAFRLVMFSFLQDTVIAPIPTRINREAIMNLFVFMLICFKLFLIGRRVYPLPAGATRRFCWENMPDLPSPLLPKGIASQAFVRSRSGFRGPVVHLSSFSYREALPATDKTKVGKQPGEFVGQKKTM